MAQRVITLVLAILMISIAFSPIINMTTSETTIDEYEQNTMKSSGFSDDDADKDGFSYAEEMDCGTDPNNANSFPEDNDEDSICDGMDDDDDNDGWSDSDEISCSTDPLMPSSVPSDQDGDGVCDEQDAFPEDDTEWSDLDGDGQGDNRDSDDDNDGVDDRIDAWPTDPCASTDTDGDGYPDFVTSSECKLEPDLDDDNDGYWDVDDDFPLDPCFARDTDDDGLPDSVLPDKNCDQTMLTDMDDDDDGWPDKGDAFPTDPTEWADFDQDGIGNNADRNDDSDGWSDLFEVLCETDPYDITSFPTDTDGDGRCDHVDLDDDNDGILDVDDSDPLLTEGSWEWATGTGDMIKINDMAMDSNGNILVTGSYIGTTSLGSFTLTQFNKEDAFVAKMDGNGDWLWATTSSNKPVRCANSGGATWSQSVSSSSIGFQTTGVYVAENASYALAPISDTIYTNTSKPSPTLHFQMGDKVYNNATSPPKFIGNVSYTTQTTIVLQEEYDELLPLGIELVKIDPYTLTVSTSTPFTINQGQWEKANWTDSYAVSNSIAVDDSGNAYITGNFDGYVKFDGAGLFDVVKSYNVRDEGNWMKKRYIEDKRIDDEGFGNAINGYPCGAPSDWFLTGTDMFVAKISSGGSWEWVKGAGSNGADSGEHIVLSADGNHAFVTGKLRQNWCEQEAWRDAEIRGSQGTGPGCNNLVLEHERNHGCEPIEHIDFPRNWLTGNYAQKNHAGMFNGAFDGVSELNGCGAFIAKISLNGGWKDATEISPPNQWLERPSGTLLPITYYPTCVQTSLGASNSNHCSDKFVQITGLVATGSPERLYVAGIYAKSLNFGDLDIYSGGYENERAFIAKYNQWDNDWDWVVNGCGVETHKCDEIHDIASDGNWYIYASGCYDDQKFVARYNFDGQEMWMQTFGNKCDRTKLAVDAGGNAYITGTYSESGQSITIGDTILEHAYDQGHFVAQIDSGGNWIWADDSDHLRSSYGGHAVYSSFPYGKNHYNGGVLSSTPTEVMVDSNERVYVSGWMNGMGWFKTDTHFGSKSYVAAIDGPFQIVEPNTTINPDGGEIPSISMVNTILLIVGVVLLVEKRKNQDSDFADD